ncbi:golgin subfamily A member 6-like protein 7 [Coccinella septempunctata]|uniref:golgin subfamily A member 6-like protein 7 n=1 Tax=Coccinella septempunctata TaxID=41139 RepID=UPI001D06016B|nr:golgin subfamily A member 6-like protein 7 [Coccinella septempunctata]
MEAVMEMIKQQFAEQESRMLREKQEEEERRQKEKQEEENRRQKDEERRQKEEERREIEKQEEKEQREQQEIFLEQIFQKTEGIIVCLKEEISAVREDVKEEIDIVWKTVKGMEGKITQEFEAVSAANGWSDQEKATALIVALRGLALAILQTISDDQHRKYGDLIATLELRYGNQYREQLYRTQLKTRIQKSNESLQEFEAGVQSLIQLAYPEAPEGFKEQLAVQTFIDGLKDIEIQRTLRLTSFKRCSEALVRSLEVEAAFNISARPKMGTVSIEESPQEDNLSRSISQVLKILEKMESRYSSVASQPRRNCFRCGRSGHFKRDCRVPGKLKLASISGRMLASDNEAPRIIQVNRIRRTTESLTIRGKVNQKDVICTVDTGASVSLVRSGILEPSTVRPPTSNFVLRTVTGENAPIRDHVQKPVNIASVLNAMKKLPM